MNKSDAIKMFQCSYDVEYSPIIYDNINGKQYKFGVYSVHQRLGEGGEFSSKDFAYDTAVKRGLFESETAQKFFDRIETERQSGLSRAGFFKKLFAKRRIVEFAENVAKKRKQLEDEIEKSCVMFYELESEIDVPKLMRIGSPVYYLICKTESIECTKYEVKSFKVEKKRNKFVINYGLSEAGCTNFEPVLKSVIVDSGDEDTLIEACNEILCFSKDALRQQLLKLARSIEVIAKQEFF